jgi:hypothetical protein
LPDAPTSEIPGDSGHSPDIGVPVFERQSTRSIRPAHGYSRGWHWPLILHGTCASLPQLSTVRHAATLLRSRMSCNPFDRVNGKSSRFPAAASDAPGSIRRQPSRLSDPAIAEERGVGETSPKVGFSASLVRACPWKPSLSQPIS